MAVSHIKGPVQLRGCGFVFCFFRQFGIKDC